MKWVLFFLAIQIGLSPQAQTDSLKIFGHRGCRGYFPENSIIGFQHAVSLGIEGIEWDVVVNKDKQLVLSHEPYFKKEICIQSDGSKIDDENVHNIYTMSQTEIEAFDCGLIGHSKFPEQQKIASTKPLLQTVLSSVDLSSVTVLFEIKSNPKEYGISQPYADEFAKIILAELDSFQLKSNIVLMSFDRQVLEALHRIAPEYRKVYLTYLPLRSARKFLQEITFTPYALSMFYPTIRRKKANYLHKKGIQLFAWNVNGEKLIHKLARKGVDGVITDYPK